MTCAACSTICFRYTFKSRLQYIYIYVYNCRLIILLLSKVFAPFSAVIFDVYIILYVASRFTHLKILMSINVFITLNIIPSFVLFFHMKPNHEWNNTYNSVGLSDTYHYQLVYYFWCLMEWNYSFSLMGEDGCQIFSSVCFTKFNFFSFRFTQ